MSKAAEEARKRRFPQAETTVVVQPVHATNRTKQAMGAPTAPIDANNPQGTAEANGGSPLRAPDGTSTALSADQLGQATYDLLTGAGFENAEAVAGASDRDLLAIDGIGKVTLAEIRAVYPANAPQGE